jgi:hypothetical protein
MKNKAGMAGGPAALRSRSQPSGPAQVDPALAGHEKHGPMRQDVRRELELTGIVNYELTYSAPAPIRDLGLHGVFLRWTSPAMTVGKDVEFVLRCAYCDKPLELRFAARVVRLAPDGIALAFGEYDDHTYTQLTNLLYAL